MSYKFIATILLSLLCVTLGIAQKGESQDESGITEEIFAARKQAIREKLEMKRGAKDISLTESLYNDTDSFGKNVKFLGSNYAGTVYVYYTCDPVIFEQEIGIALAPDDKCVAYTPSTPGSSFEFFDPAWEITIPKNSVNNVIYTLVNNNVGYDASNFDSTLFPVVFSYTPRITIESEALNDPAAIDPSTGLPMNGKFTTSLTGNRFRNLRVPLNEFTAEYDSYGSVAGRGLSRVYFEAIGLPNNVINKLFNKPMKLKFGIRGRATGPVDFAQFFYTIRLMGQ
jgi:hypothetical protein